MENQTALDLIGQRLSELQNETGVLYVPMFEQLLAKVAEDAHGRAHREGFDEGFQQAAAIEQERARADVAAYALRVLGKERGDGEVNLGALGLWFVKTTDATAAEVK